MAVCARAVPWWSLCLNWLIGPQVSQNFLETWPADIHVLVFFGNLVGSLFFGAILVRCRPSSLSITLTFAYESLVRFRCHERRTFCGLCSRVCYVSFCIRAPP
jgi:hypothetical protein